MYKYNIAKSEHYKEFHEQHVPFFEVVQVIGMSNEFRKKGDNYEIETERYYILFKIEGDTIWIINAKTK